MKRKAHWTEIADRDGDFGLIGEDEDGVLWVPSRVVENYWDRRLSLWRPTHWRYYLRSRRKKSLAFIERADLKVHF